MKKKLLALLLALLMVLALPPAALAETAQTETAQEEEAAPEQSVEGLMEALTDRQLATRTELADVVHQVFVSDMTCSLRRQIAQTAADALAALQVEYRMGLAEQAALDAAAAEADRAQAEADKAELEHLKLAARVRALTGLDMRSAQLNAQDIFLTLRPEQITLAELNDAVTAYAAPDERDAALLQMEQDYIDISLYYAEIGTANSDYAAAAGAREDMALELVMGRATAQAFSAATIEMKQARLALFTAISDYSRLLYRINLACGGALSDKAGLLTDYLGTGA